MLKDASPETIYWFIAGLSLFGIMLGWFMVRALRTQSYERWPWPFRWGFYALFLYLVVGGGLILALLYLERLGLYTFPSERSKATSQQFEP